MLKEHQSRLGAFASIVVGVSYLVGAVIHLLSPEDGRAAAGPLRYWPAIAERPGFVAGLDVAFIIGALFAFAALPAIGRHVGRRHKDWTQFAVLLGLLGFSAAALVDATALGRMSTVSLAFVAGDASTRAAIAAEPVLLLDGYGVLMFLVPGLWLLIVNAVALIEATLARGWAIVGIVAGLGFLLLPAGFVTGTEALIGMGAVLSGVLLGPAWYIGVGLALRKDVVA